MVTKKKSAKSKDVEPVIDSPVAPPSVPEVDDPILSKVETSPVELLKYLVGKASHALPSFKVVGDMQGGDNFAQGSFEFGGSQFNIILKKK